MRGLPPLCLDSVNAKEEFPNNAKVEFPSSNVLDGEAGHIGTAHQQLTEGKKLLWMYGPFSLAVRLLLGL